MLQINCSSEKSIIKIAAPVGCLRGLLSVKNAPKKEQWEPCLTDSCGK